MRHILNSMMTIVLWVFIAIFTGPIGTGFIVSIIIMSILKAGKF